MTARKRNWIIAIGLVTVLTAAALAIVASVLAARIEPYVRQEAIRYLSQRFDSDVKIQSLRVRLPETSAVRLVLTRGRGISVSLEGEGLSLRLKRRSDAVPLFVIQKFRCDVDLESLFHPPVVVPQVFVDGMEIQIPPRSEVPRLPSPAAIAPGGPQGSFKPDVVIRKVSIQRAGLVLQPRNPQRFPLRFDIESLQLESGEAGAPMKYDASLTNAKPPGKIHSTGTFGPWSAAEPGDTPLAGDYRFEQGDLGVFSAIAGTLQSSGRFEGTLSAITVHGQASVPDFRLRTAGSPVPLLAHFAVLVDGTTGNTILQPVTATLASTNFTTNGGIIRHEANQPRAVSLDVAMPNGNLTDVLRLTMKGAPFMAGRLTLNTKIEIPPLTGNVRDKLELDGRFEVRDGRFLHSTIQNQIDRLSKRIRAQPENSDGDQVVSHMTGLFHLQNAVMRFRKLSFGVPGADLDLAGDYNLESDALDFDGTLKLQPTVSQISAGGWKKAALHLVDRLLEKEGVGILLHIRVEGTSKEPVFGLLVGGRQWEAPLPKR